jgi:hypothetical protein
MDNSITTENSATKPHVVLWQNFFLLSLRTSIPNVPATRLPAVAVGVWIQCWTCYADSEVLESNLAPGTLFLAALLFIVMRTVCFWFVFFPHFL